MDNHDGPAPAPKPNILGDTEDFGPAKIASGQLATPIVDEKAAAEAEKALAERDPNHRVPAINLLSRPEATDIEPVPTPIPALADRERPPKVRTSHRKLVVSLLGLVAVVLGAGGAAAYDSLAPGPLVQLRVFPTPAPKPSATPTPSATTSPIPSATSTPTPTPTPTTAPQTITALTTTPTKENPQTVTVTSKSGVWLRSSPTSVNQSNVIGWIPNGAQVSVDQTGDFWWHGTYKGQSGYFASKYTQ